MNSEKMIFQIVASRTNTSKGDISEFLLAEGFFDGGPIPKGLSKRDDLFSGGNPVDLKDTFDKQNPE
jgi:hypothetical protein